MKKKDHLQRSYAVLQNLPLFSMKYLLSDYMVIFFDPFQIVAICCRNSVRYLNSDTW